MSKVYSLIVIAIVFFIYKSFFSLHGTFSSGDWPYLFPENIKEFSLIPQYGTLWIRPYYEISAKIAVEYLGINWHIAERLLWFWPFVIIIVLSSYALFKSWIPVLIYTTNTYIIMIVGGGQLGVAVSYAIAPLVIYTAVKLKNSILIAKINNFRFIQKTLFFCLLFSLQVLFDPRISYITFLFLLISIVFFYKDIIHRFKQFLMVGVVLGTIVFFVNSFWIIPLITGREAFESVAKGYDSLSGFKFLSMADFSHAFSLLHPNWPENIFGKTYFLQPEFIILPIVAFWSFLIIKRTGKEKKILLFGFIALLGAFLSKGANAPFGEINIWLYEHIPGMSMFRDPSKFYPLVVLGYTFLIPLSLETISRKIPFGKLLPIIFVLFWCVLIRQSILGEVNGTFKPRTVPFEYIELKDYIISQPKQTVSMWVPARQRFGFSSNFYPSLSAEEVLGNTNPLRIARIIGNDKDMIVYDKLKKLRIRFIIVPYDSEKELFLVDRKYSDTARNEIINELNKVSWLIKLPDFKQISIYSVK